MLHHAGHDKRRAVNEHCEAGEVAAAVELPRQLLVQQDAVFHQIVVGKVAAGGQIQRVKVEIVPAHGQHGGVGLSVAARDADLAGGAPGVGHEVFHGVGRGVLHRVGHLQTEGLNLGLIQTGPVRQEQRDLGVPGAAVPRPPQGRLLAFQRAARGLKGGRAADGGQAQAQAHRSKHAPDLLHRHPVPPKALEIRLFQFYVQLFHESASLT